MATWRPPKTSYWVTPPAKVPGGSDFQRIEENIQYLKEVTGVVKGTVSLTGPSTRTVTHNLGTTNVIVDIGFVDGSGFIYRALTSPRYKILNSNQISISNTMEGNYTVAYTIARVK